MLLVSSSSAQSVFSDRGIPGLSTSGVVVADLNHDGRLDVVSLEDVSSVSSVTTLVGEGFAFAEAAQKSSIPGKNASGLALGDVDADGNLDAMSCGLETASAKRRPYLGLGDGSGAFAFGPTGPDPEWREGSFSDLDLDGDLDFVGFRVGALFTLTNSGSGVFSAGGSLTIPDLGLNPSAPRRLHLGDFDSDGDDDVASMSSWEALRLFRNTRSGGSATLSAWQSFEPNPEADDFAVIDLHGDGDLDFAVTGTNSGNPLTIIEGLGQGAFSIQGPVPFAPRSSFVVGADLDLDGKGDLLTETASYRSLASGAPILFGSHVLPPARRTIVADFNGDDRPDALLIGDDGFATPYVVGEIAINDGSGQFLGAAASDLNGIRGGYYVGHLDGDQEFDLLTIDQLAAPAGFFARIEQGLGNGTFAAGGLLALDVLAQSGMIAPPALAIDVDHDGLPDLITADSNASASPARLQVALTDGNGGFRGKVTSILPSAANLLHVGFVNADSHVDVVLQRIVSGNSEFRVAFGDGLGSFAVSPFVTSVAGPAIGFFAEPTVVSDVDGDGLGDLILRSSPTSALRIRRGLGDGSFTNLSNVPWSDAGVFTAGELTGDGILDLILLATGGSTLRLEIRPGLGNGTFSTGPTLTSLPMSDVLGVERIDFNGDGLLDLLAFDPISGSFAAWANQGGASFAPPEYRRIARSTVFYPSRVAPLFADIDHDGRRDAIAVAGTTELLHEIVTEFGECRGRSVRYGFGCPGTGGFVPRLNVVGSPCPGASVSLEIRGGVGNSLALVLMGAGEGSIPMPNGCELLVLPLLPLQFTVPLLGAGFGNGEITIPTTLPSTIDGVSLTLQALCADPGVPGGASSTAGTALRFDDGCSRPG